MVEKARHRIVVRHATPRALAVAEPDRSRADHEPVVTAQSGNMIRMDQAGKGRIALLAENRCRLIDHRLALTAALSDGTFGNEDTCHGKQTLRDAGDRRRNGFIRMQISYHSLKLRAQPERKCRFTRRVAHPGYSALHREAREQFLTVVKFRRHVACGTQDAVRIQIKRSQQILLRAQCPQSPLWNQVQRKLI